MEIIAVVSREALHGCDTMRCIKKTHIEKKPTMDPVISKEPKTISAGPSAGKLQSIG